MARAVRRPLPFPPLTTSSLATNAHPRKRLGKGRNTAETLVG
jgi:hypothetical protein